METYSIDQTSLVRDGKAFFPVMGEFHFSRYPEQGWEEEIRKMKACGMDILATYVFWIHHEEEEGVFDFSGQRNLRHFLELCDKWDMHVWLRIGPWAHGEARNWGFPDWLLKKGYELRADDPDYLKLVERFWKKIYKEVEGTHCILGIQIENEYGHVGGLRGTDGEQHMRTLKKLAEEIGFAAPYWTATGWGGAVIGDLTPVMGGYCDAPWDASLTKLPPNKNYLFTAVRNDGNIGSDYAPGMELSFDKDAYPYLTAELGGGLQVTHRRRPRVKAEDIGAMSVCKLGSGCNLLGYYMYHGGTNPKGKFSTLQESTAVGSFCDVPELSYDFQAPIREYGQISETAKELKLLAMFVHDYGETFCGMTPQFTHDDGNAENLSNIRRIVRRNGDGGYLFVNNYQRGYEMAEHEGISLGVSISTGEIHFPKQDIKNGDYFFYPFQFPLADGQVLRWINQTPLCQINRKLWFFYGTEPLSYELNAAEMLSGQALVVTDRIWAKRAWQMAKYPNALFFSEAPFLETETGMELIRRSDCTQDVCWMVLDTAEELAEPWLTNGWKIVDEMPDFLHVEGDTSILCVLKYDLKPFENPVGVAFEKEGCECEREAYQEYSIQLTCDKICDAASEDVFLQIDFQADQAELYLDGEKIADQYYIGDAWEVGLKRFAFPTELTLRLYPLKETDEIYLETQPDYTDGVCCKLNEIRCAYERKENLVSK